LAQKKKDPSKGRSLVVRAKSELPLAPTMAVVPVYAAPTEAIDASPLEADDRTTRLSFTFKLPGFGRLKFESARFFRRRK
jgi:hypothetical protein